jgi:hypothetical protein
MEAGSGPIDVRLNATAARLLVQLAQEMGEENPSAVVVRALGLLEMAHRTRRRGGKLVFVNERGESAEVAF